MARQRIGPMLGFKRFNTTAVTAAIQEVALEVLTAELEMVRVWNLRYSNSNEVPTFGYPAKAGGVVAAGNAGSGTRSREDGAGNTGLGIA